MAIETGQDCWRCNSPKCDEGVTLQSAIIQLCGDCYDLYVDDEMQLQLDLAERAELLDHVVYLESEKSRLEEVGESISLDNQSLKYEVSELQVEIGQLKEALKIVTSERDQLRLISGDAGRAIPVALGDVKSIETIWANGIKIYENRAIIPTDENDTSPIEEIPVEIKEDFKPKDPGWDDDPRWIDYLESRDKEEEVDDDPETSGDGSVN